MDVERIELEDWRDALPKSGYEVFHDPNALAVLDDHTDGEMRLYGAYKGQQSVGLFPTFVANRSIGRAVFSPPPSLGVPRLGPIVDPNSPKRRKRERINDELAAGVIDALDVGNRTALFRTICPLEYGDPRPYGWNDLTVEPQFTYVVDLDDADMEDVMAGFSKSLRREIRNGTELDIEIRREGVDGARSVYEETKARFHEQGESFPMSREYVEDLVAALDDRARVYVARTPDGQFLSGITVLYSADLAYFWQGGTRATHDGVSVNSLLHYEIMRDVLTDPELDSVTGYDLVGANTERLCDYKGKFNGHLRPYYVVESSGIEMSLAKSAYQTFASVK